MQFTRKPRPRRPLLLLAIAGALLGALVLAPTAGAAVIKQASFPPGDQAGTARWARPAVYVVGTYYSGNSFWAQGPSENGWRWGYLGGNVHQCVWVWDANFPAGGTPADPRCGAPRRESTNNDPAACWGVSFCPNTVWTDDTGADGLPAVVDPSRCGGSVPRYHNAAVWAATTTPFDPRGPNITSNMGVRKRYLTRDRSTILVHDHLSGSTTGDLPSPWFFVPANCVRAP
jgi:hypothetical protein